MTAQDFCYWLQGAFELENREALDKNQIQIIQDHLNLVFKKETPVRNSFLEESRERYKGVPLPFGPFPSSPVITC